MKLGKYINPFFLLPITFLFLLWLYSWGWSDFLPKLTPEVYIFIIIFSVILLLISIIFKKHGVIAYSPVPIRKIKKEKPIMVLLILTFLCVIDIVYSGTIPLLAGNIREYLEFGIPVIDPLIIALIIFYSIYWFHVCLSVNKKIYLLYILFNFLLLVIMVRRAAMVYILISCILIFVQKINRVKAIFIVFTICLLMGFSFAFGYLGNAKSGLEDNEYVPKYLQASDAFFESGVAYEHYMTYVYITSPLANFQLTVQRGRIEEYSFGDLLLEEYVPDFLANRISDLFEIDRTPRKMEQVMEVLNVGTYFVGGYLYYGWFGIILHCFYMILLALPVYLLYTPKNPYQVTINAFLCSLFLMSLFSNVFRIFVNWIVVVLPLLIAFISRLKIDSNKVT